MNMSNGIHSGAVTSHRNHVMTLHYISVMKIRNMIPKNPIPVNSDFLTDIVY